MKLSSCHPNRKHKAKGLCGSCYDRKLKDENKEYKERQNQNTKKWFSNSENSEKWKAQDKSRRKARSIDPVYKESHRNSELKRLYGITVEDYNRMLKEQDNKCALCFREQGNRKLHTDHDHKTGKVRGLLCHQCNWYLGTIDADPEIISRIIQYRNSQHCPTSEKTAAKPNTSKELSEVSKKELANLPEIFQEPKKNWLNGTTADQVMMTEKLTPLQMQSYLSKENITKLTAHPVSQY